MAWTILNVAFPFAPVGPDAAGGAEQVLSLLDRALCAAGHRSIVIACTGSRVAGELVPIALPSVRFDDGARPHVHRQVRAALDQLLARERIDLIHMHGIDFHAYLPQAGPPVLATLHMPLEWYPPEALLPVRPRTCLHCVSASQRARCRFDVPFLPDIPNGVPLAWFEPQPTHDDYLLVLGRICPEKGVHLAIDAAKQLDLPLLIAGEVFPYAAHQRYFREQITPRLDAARRFIGAVGVADKPRLLARARCLLVPSLVPETSSLAAMEALASGTPVVAFPNGALSSIVEHGRTGFLANDFEEMLGSLRRVDELDRAACRAAAEARFSDAACRARYFATYEALIQPTGARARRAALRVREIDELDQLRALVPAWSALFARCPEATVFQRPEWLLTWCEHLLAGQLRVLALYDAQRLVGLFPLFRYDAAEGRVLALMGAGVSDYQDALIDPAQRGRVLAAFRAWLRAGSDWDRCVWSELAPWSPLRSCPVGAPLRERWEPQEPCLALTLPPWCSSLSQLVAPKLWRNLLYGRRRAEREGGLRVALADMHGFPASFRDHMQLHVERRARAGGESAFVDPKLAAFHLDAAQRLFRSRAALLYGLWVGADLVASMYALQDRSVTRFYMIGLSHEHAHCSAGSLIIAHVLEQALARGDRLADFMRGDEPYKRWWGAREHARLARRVLERPSEAHSAATSA